MFAVRNLSVLGYANGITQWIYKSPDLLSQALKPGYFDAAKDMLANGDWLFFSYAEVPGLAAQGAILFIKNTPERGVVPLTVGMAAG